jgi:pyruvate dehydrogenase E1 component
VVLGTDGYGRSDSRRALREFFEVDCKHIVLAALKALNNEGNVDSATVTDAIEKLGIDAEKPNPVSV